MRCSMAIGKLSVERDTMTILPTVLGIVAGICFYVGVVHLLIGWRRPEKATHLLFACLCFCIVGVALSDVALYQAQTVAAYASAMKWQLAYIFVAAVLLIWFIAYYTNVRPIRFLLALNGMLALALVMDITSPFGLFFASIDRIGYVTLPWGERIAQPMGTIIGAWVWLVRSALMLIQLYSLYACYRQYRRGERQAALSLILSLSFVLLARWHDHLALASGTPSLFLVEYGFLALIMVMSLGLLDDLIRVGIIKQELIANERRWRELLESVKLAVISLDKDGLIEYINPHYLGLTGFARSEVLGREFTAFVPECHHACLRALAEQMRTGTTFPPHVQIPLRTRGVEERMIAWSNVRLQAPGGGFAGMLSIGADITERIAAEAEIRLLNTELEQRVAARTAELWASNEQLEQQRQLAGRRLRVAEHLSELLDLLNDDHPIDALWQQIVAAIRPLFAVQATAIYQFADGMYTPLAASLSSVDTAATLLRRSQSALEQALADNQPVAMSVVVDDLTASSTIATTIEHAYPAVLTVPLVSGHSFVGGMVLGYASPRTFTNDEIALAVAFADQVVLVIENAQLRRQVAAAAASDERTRLARDLHDAVTQTLYSASLVAEVLPVVWNRDAAEGMRNLLKLRQLVRGALAEMRTLLFELRPAALLAADLSTLLKQLADRLTGNSRIPVELTIDGQAKLSADVKIAVYRIAQEAFNNIAKHASASQVWVTLRVEDGQLFLSVRDDGRGFDPSSISGDHLGTRIMAERAAGIGARLHITSAPRHGTEVMLSWPAE